MIGLDKARRIETVLGRIWFRGEGVESEGDYLEFEDVGASKGYGLAKIVVGAVQRIETTEKIVDFIVGRHKHACKIAMIQENSTSSCLPCRNKKNA